MTKKEKQTSKFIKSYEPGDTIFREDYKHCLPELLESLFLYLQINPRLGKFDSPLEGEDYVDDDFFIIFESYGDA